MTYLKIVLATFMAWFIIVWLASRLAFYVSGPGDAKVQSFKQFVMSRGGHAARYINYTDTVIKIISFGVLITYVWHRS